MAAPGLGNASFLQIGREAVYDTAVAATKRIRVVRLSPRHTQGKIPSRMLSNSAVQPEIYAGGRIARGSFEVELSYENMGFLLEAVMGTGTYGSGGAVTTGTNPYTHILRNKGIFNSYTLQEGLGDIPTGKCERVSGAKFPELVLSGRSGLDNTDNIVTARLSYIGKTITTNVTPTSLSNFTPLPVMFWHIATDDDGTADGTAGVVKGFELSIRNKLVETWENQFIREPVFNGYTEVQLKLDTEFQTRTALDEYLANTAGSPTIGFSNGGYSFTISMDRAYLTEPVVHDAQDAGVMSQELVYTATDDGASPSTGVAITVVNTQSTFTS